MEIIFVNHTNVGLSTDCCANANVQQKQEQNKNSRNRNVAKSHRSRLKIGEYLAFRLKKTIQLCPVWQIENSHPTFKAMWFVNKLMRNCKLHKYCSDLFEKFLASFGIIIGIIVMNFSCFDFGYYYWKENCSIYSIRFSCPIGDPFREQEIAVCGFGRDSADLPNARRISSTHPQTAYNPSQRR